KKFGAITDQVQALYDGSVDAIILNESYRHNVEDFEQYKDFSDKTEVLYSFVYYTDKNNTANSVSDVTSKPFTIFISGNDSYGTIDELTRSDVNMLVTVNPKTSRVLLTSIPRDYYVPLVCSDGACAEGALDKLTHTGMHGINTTKETLESLLDVDINYTFRVNFSSAEQIVDALGGVDITVEPGLEIESFGADGALGGLDAGTHHLDGAHALAFARERYAYEDGDVQRVKNQQQVLEAIIHKAISSDTLANYSTILKSMEGAFETNMSQDEIASLMQFQLRENPNWKFENYVLNGQGADMFCAELGTGASVLVPDQRTIDIAKKKIDAIIDGESSKTVDDQIDENIVYPSYMTGVEPTPVVVDESQTVVSQQAPVYTEPAQPQYYEDYSQQTYVDPYQVQQPVVYQEPQVTTEIVQ
ncbi:MAG: LCP family protein, partial [Erysipelotrichaceae bacterium]|nr:LCP family protein [Erysipelotrichaceae bacterium]